MTTTEETQRWRDLFATRARGDIGGGILEILALAGNTELIPFAGGFPDPQTFPGAEAAAFLDLIVRDGDLSAFGRTIQGRALVRLGQIDRGMARSG